MDPITMALIGAQTIAGTIGAITTNNAKRLADDWLKLNSAIDAIYRRCPSGTSPAPCCVYTVQSSDNKPMKQVIKKCRQKLPHDGAKFS